MYYSCSNLLSTSAFLLEKALLTDAAKWFSIKAFLDSYDIPFTVEERDNVRYMSSAGMCGHLCACMCINVCLYLYVCARVPVSASACIQLQST